MLLLQIEPDGKSYELELTGKTVHPEPVYQQAPAPGKSGKVTGKPAALFSNKSFLAWGGVPVSRAHQQTLTLKNMAQHMLKLRMEIRSSHKDFNVSE